jgi:hypothetical protein
VIGFTTSQEPCWGCQGVPWRWKMKMPDNFNYHITISFCQFCNCWSGIIDRKREAILPQYQPFKFVSVNLGVIKTLISIGPYCWIPTTIQRIFIIYSFASLGISPYYLSWRLKVHR